MKCIREEELGEREGHCPGSSAVVAKPAALACTVAAAKTWLATLPPLLS